MDENEIVSALTAGAALSDIRSIGDSKFVVVPNDYKMESLESLMPVPTRTRLMVILDDLDSFVRYIKKFKIDDSQIFVKTTTTGVAFVGVIDFDSDGSPAWRQHQAKFTAIPTPEWTRWMGANKKPMKQVEFAEFLEANQITIVDPLGADLLEMVQTLEGKNNARFKSVKRLSNGRQALEYVEDIELKGESGSQSGQIEMPQMLKLGLAPFQGGSNYAVAARLRYRIAEQVISFQYELIDPHLVIRSVVGEMLETIKKECEIEPWQGSF